MRGLWKQGKTSGDPRKDPYAVLLAKLSGVTSPPKARQGYQQMMHEAYAEKVAPILAERWAEQHGEGSDLRTSKEPTATFWAQISREVFAAMSQADRDGYGARAKAEAASARAAYDKLLKQVPSQTPEAKQE
jgi:hypothetical protein